MGKLRLKLRAVICFEQMLVLSVQFFGGTIGSYSGSNIFEMSLCSGSDFCELSKKLVLRLGFFELSKKLVLRLGFL